MRHAYLLLITTSMLAVGLGTAVAPGTEPSDAGAAPPATGLHLQIVPEQSTFAPGEPVRASLLLRNPTSEAVTVVVGDVVGQSGRIRNGTDVPVVVMTRHHDHPTPRQVPAQGALVLIEGATVWDEEKERGNVSGGPMFAAYRATIQDQGVVLHARAGFDIGGGPGVAEATTGTAQAAGTSSATSASGAGSGGYNKAANEWTSMPFTWRYNPAGQPSTAAPTAIAAAMQTWEDDGASWVDHTRTNDTNARHNGVYDTYNTVEWCSCDPGGIAVAHSWTWEGDSQIQGCDVEFNGLVTYSTGTTPVTGQHDMQTIMSHEGAHCFGMQHLMDPGECDTSIPQTCHAGWMGTNNQGQTLYWRGPSGNHWRRSPNWGDVAGMRWAYANSYTAVSGLTQPIAESDSALYDIDGNGQADLLNAWAEDPSGANPVYYRVRWNVDPNTGQSTSETLTKTALADIGHATAGLGVALHDVDNSGRPDLVVAWVDDPSGDNYVYYRIGWNVNTAGDVTGGWSTGWTQVGGGPIGWYTQGLGVCLGNLDADERKELVVAWADDSLGANVVKYRVGANVNTAGGVTTWTQQDGPTGLASTNVGAGVACTDVNENGKADLAFSWANDNSGQNAIVYEVAYDVSSTGYRASWSGHSTSPYPNMGDNTRGLGFAAAELENGHHHFDTGAQGFAKPTDRTYSNVRWYAYRGDLSLQSDRRDTADEIMRKDLPFTLDSTTSFNVKSRWTTWNQGNWQAASPLFLTGTTDPTDVNTQAGTAYVYYESRDSNLGEKPTYRLRYRDAGGVLRVDTAYTGATPNGKFEFEIDLKVVPNSDGSIASRELRLTLRDLNAGYTIVTNPYYLGATEAFSMRKVGIASDGWGGAVEPAIGAYVDSIVVNSRQVNGQRLGGGQDFVWSWTAGGSLKYMEEWNGKLDAHP